MLSTVSTNPGENVCPDGISVAAADNAISSRTRELTFSDIIFFIILLSLADGSFEDYLVEIY